MTRRRTKAVLALVVFACAVVAGPSAQDAPPPGADDAATVLSDRTTIQDRMAQLQASPLLEEEARAEILAIYASALERLDLADQWAERRADFERRRDEAPASLQQLRATLSGMPPTPVPPEVPAGLGVAELDQRASQAEAEVAAAQAEVDRLLAERAARDVRRTEVPTSAAEAEARLDALEQEAAATTPEDAINVVALARDRAEASLLAARRLATTAELAALDLEIKSYEALREVNEASRELAARRLARAELAATVWRENAATAQEDQARRAADEARRQAAAADPVLTTLAEANAELAERRTGDSGLLARISEARAQLVAMREEVGQLAADFDSVEAKYKAAGQTPAIGLLMVTQRAGLPDVGEYRRRADARRDETATVQLRFIETEEEQEELEDGVEESVAGYLAALDPDRPLDEVAEVERAARSKLESRRDLLGLVEQDYKTYVDVLSDLDVAEDQLIAKTEQFADFIDERVLWVRLLPPLHDDPELIDNTRAAAAWLFDPPAWADMLAGAGRVATEFSAFQTGAWGLLILLLLLLKPNLRRRLDLAGEAVTHLRTDRFRLTLRALVDTVLLAVPLPLALWIFADLIADGSTGALETEQAPPVAAALQVVATFWFVIDVFGKASRKGGLGEAHFRYAPESLKRLRPRLRVLVLLGLPVLFIDEACASVGSESLRRLAFITGEIVLVWFLVSLLRLPSGVLAPHLERHADGWLARTRWLWLIAAIGLPATLITLVELGYVYTASQLEERVRATLVIVLALFMVYSLILRGLTVARRRLAFDQFLRRRAAAAQEPEGGVETVLVEEDEIDVSAVSDQSRRLVTTLTVFLFAVACWWIWADVLPALKVLDDWPLWQRSAEVVERIEDPDGGADRIMVVPDEVPVTVADVLMSLIWVVLTMVGARNGPGLLEIAVLQRLPIQRAGRYATTTIARYLIVIVGLAGAFNAIGIGWGQVQWLAAAVSVGLGFGLQEIFANFVSGLILLFERPVRVGDTVTVAGVTGMVSRIHMRATTITTWDETELVVPNKEFITSQLVNWTLSTSTLRVIATVGIAYGSDTELATTLLYKVARKTKHVLEDPSPRVVFKSFGDSTLDFELRCYVDSPEHFRTIHHQLNTGIDQAFREAGIEIAFPQRDLHLRSSDISLRLERTPRTSGPGAGEPVPEPGGGD